MSAQPINQHQSVPQASQSAILRDLATTYPDLDLSKVLFLNPLNPAEPWFPSELLISIARQEGQFELIEEGFDQFIPALNQIVHYALVSRGAQSFRRSGVATIGEKIPVDGIDVNMKEYRRMPEAHRFPDAHQLAASRALVATLDAAGFNPYKTQPGLRSVANSKAPNPRYINRGLEEGLAPAPPPQSLETDTISRENDLSQIHILAEQCGLIRPIPGHGKDMADYRAFLLENWGVKSAVGLDQTTRASVINKLKLQIDQRDQSS